MRRPSVIVPTLDAGRHLPALADALASQTSRPAEWLVVDSGSTDGTPSIARKLGATVVSVPRQAFQHGRTRNLAASLAVGDVLVFLSQDALPLGERWLERLTEGLGGDVAASFARQVPRADASLLEQFARATNYPAVSRTVTHADVDRLGIRALFFSNACSAIDRQVFVDLGGFPETTIMNEDMLFAARLLKAGHAIRYAADSIVQHSHAYRTTDTFKRYFDIGVFFTQAAPELPTTRLERQGAAYVVGLLAFLARSHAWWTVPRALIESFAKWSGQFLGRRYEHLPVQLRPRFSLHARYWESGGR